MCPWPHPLFPAIVAESYKEKMLSLSSGSDEYEEREVAGPSEAAHWPPAPSGSSARSLSAASCATAQGQSHFFKYKQFTDCYGQSLEFW